MKDYIKKILAIAVPIMLSNLISQLQMLIDKVFIGRLSLESMSAVGNASTPMWTTMSIIFALTTGATILVSQLYGANELEKATATLASVFKFNNGIGILLFLFWFFTPQVAFNLMGVDESIIGMSIDYAHYFAPIFILTGIGASISCMLQVSQKTQLFGTFFVITTSSILVMVFHMGILEIFGMVVVDEILRFILNSWKLRKIRGESESLVLHEVAQEKLY